MSWQFNHKKQIKLLDTVHRLTVAGLKQRDIAGQLLTYGSAIEQQIARQLLESIDSGLGFAPGLKSWIDRLAWQALIAGERAGDLENGLSNALLTLRTRSASTTVIAKALGWPLLGVSGILAASAGIAAGLMPKFAVLYPMPRWDTLTQLAWQFGLFWQDWGLVIGGGLTTLLVVIALSLPLLTGPLRHTLDNLPIYRQYRLIQTSALLYSLGNLMTARYGLLDSLANIRQHASPFLAWHVDKMIAHVHDGNVNLGDIMDTGLLSPSEQSTLKLLGQIGNSATILLRSAAMHHAIITDEVALLQSLGKDGLKIIGALIGGLMFGGMAMLILGIATNTQLAA